MRKQLSALASATTLLLVTTALPATGALPATTALPADAALPAVAVVPPTPRITGTVASGFQSPWGLAILPDGSALVSERDTARIKHVTAAGVVRQIGTVPGVRHGGEGGLLGIAVAPTFGTDRLLYAYHTASGDNRVVRMTYNGSSLGTPQTVVTGIPRANIHNGGRLAFGPDGFLYISTGDAANTANAQNPNSLGGKILRVTPTGSPAPGNPSGTRVYSLGHRNVQGLAWDEGKRLWASELGQNTFDELNQIKPGGNYGWPTCEGTCNDSRFINPQATWSTAQASPSGLAFASSTLWMAALRGQRLWAIPVKDGARDGSPVASFTNQQGRLRTITPAADGSLWLISETNGTILRVVLG